MADPVDVIERDAARVLLLNPQGRVLLFRCHEPGADRSFWITPGGGLEPGESHEQAALRELHEETGLSAGQIGPCVWKRTHTFPWMGRTLRQRERFFLMRVEGHEVDPVGHTQEELMVLTDHRWWSVQEIRGATDERFAPRRLGDLLSALLSGPTPKEPIDVGA